MPRFRLKTKLVLAISGMVFALVAILSYLYVSQFVRQRIADSYDGADFVAHQIFNGARQAIETDFSSTPIDTSDPAQLQRTIEESLQSDPGLNSLLQSIVGYSPTIYYAAITDADGVAMVHTDGISMGKTLPVKQSFAKVRDGGFRKQLEVVYGAPRVYEVTLPIQRVGKPFGEIRVGLSTVFLNNELRPQLNRALTFSIIAILVSLALAAGLSNIALRPLAAIGRRLDQMTAGVPDAAPEPGPRADEYGVVNAKIDRLGRQVRDVKEVFSALKENLDQIMGTLEDGLVLFTRDTRIVLVSAAAERFVGRPRSEMLGATMDQVFTEDTALGRMVLDAFAVHHEISQREIETGTGHRVQLSLDFIEEGGERIGALLTMRDAESVRRIENEIELSRRLAAIGRLTSGVAHEVKNPINAIVVHLEVLRQKLQQIDPQTRRHLDIIGSEIQRLDRVVQTLVDFTRPVELQLKDLDLRKLVEDVSVLASPDAARQNVRIENLPSTELLPVRIDSDLVKQALLNVVLNGVQAMADGGVLTIRSQSDNGSAIVEVRDQGPGIPAEIRDKIFNLYFTTKKAGSGIGLAMTYRVMQLHNGALEFDSISGEGTSFRLQLPLQETGESVEATRAAFNKVAD
jgi:PAS domain S-box-containing protein